MNRKYDEHNCEMKNEAACEEEVEEDGMSYEDVEGDEFGE